MSKFRTLPYAVLTGSLLFGGSAYAQSMYSIDQRQDYQQNRIEQGIRSGQITQSEAYRLEQGERAIDRAQARARADGVVTQQERNRIDRMTDRQGQQIYRQSHDSQQAWDRGQNWGRTDGRYDGWRDRYTHAGRDGGRDGWGNHGWGERNPDRNGPNHNWSDRGDQGRHYGWTNGQHNGWDGNRPPGVERRDAWNDHRIANGTRDGSLTRGEANRLDHNQNRIDRYQANARSDGRVTPYERGRIDQMQNNQSQRIYNARHNERTQPTAPAPQQPSTNNGGWRMQQASMTPQAPRQQQPQQNWGGGGFRMQQASAPAPAAPRQASAPTAPRPTYTAPSGGQRTRSR
jgi:uncharacterized membrane protein YebE (DUF533 family)